MSIAKEKISIFAIYVFCPSLLLCSVATNVTAMRVYLILVIYTSLCIFLKNEKKIGMAPSGKAVLSEKKLKKYKRM